MDRLAVKLYYDGTLFRGFQRQPHAHTVEGEVLTRLSSSGCIREPKGCRYSAASRTDAGVTAVSQTISFDTECSCEDVLEVLDGAGFTAWTCRSVDPEFHPRYWALWREYHYVMCDAHVRTLACRIETLLKAVTSTTDFSGVIAWDKKKPFETGFRRVLFAGVRRWGDCLVLVIRGESFGKRMVGNMVSALIYSAAHGLKPRELLSILRGDVRLPRHGSAFDPSHLVLYNVRYPFAFPRPSGKLLSRLLHKLRSHTRRALSVYLEQLFSSSRYLFELL